MTLAYLSGTALPSRAASALHVCKMSAALSRTGTTTRLYAYQNPNEPESVERYFGLSEPFEARLFDPPARSWGWGFDFSRQVRRHEAGLASAVQARYFYGRHPHALLAVAQPQRPVAYEAHALPRTKFGRGVEWALFRKQGFRALVCITHALAEAYRVRLGYKGPIEVLADAADPPDRSATPIKDWPGRVGRLQAGYVGHLYPGKGIDLIIAIAGTLPEIDVHVVGGEDKDISRWRDRARLQNLHFHGYVPHQRLGSYYQRFDVALMPLGKRVEGAARQGDIASWTSPLKAFEYMAWGLPIVAADRPVLREVFREGHNALMARPDDVEHWARRLRELHGSPALRTSLGAAAQSQFQACHSWDRRAERVLGLFQ